MSLKSRCLGWLLPLLLISGWVQAGPKIQSWETKNGTRVLFVEAPELPMLDIRAVFDAGSARDGSLAGLSQLTNGLLTDGAGAWDANAIADRIGSVGAELGAESLRDMAWVSVRTLTEPGALATSLETLAAVLAEPRFEAADIERNREIMLASLKQGEQSPSSVVSKEFYRTVYGDHPYGIDGDGTRESLQRIGRDDLVAFHKRYYVAKNMVLAVVGAIDRAQAERVAEQLAGKLPTGEAATDTPPVAQLEKGVNLHKPFPSTQSHILIGAPGMRRGDPDYFVLYVGNHVLGGNGLVSILSDEVREKRGLSYSVYSYFSPMRDLGPFVVGAQTQNAKVEEALGVMQETLRRYREQGPTEEELKEAKQNITGGFPLRIASNQKIVEYLAMLGFYGLPLDYLDTFAGKIEAVTREQIIDAFRRRVDPERMATVVVGKWDAPEAAQR